MAKRAESQASRIKGLQAELGEAKDTVCAFEAGAELLRTDLATAQRQATELAHEKENLKYQVDNLQQDLAEEKENTAFQRGIAEGWEQAIRAVMDPLRRIVDAVVEKITEEG
jgi:chromosome segregation ATPase